MRLLFCLVFLARSCAFSQDSGTKPKYADLAALGSGDPAGDTCGKYFRIAKIKKVKKIIFRFAGDDKASVLPAEALSTVYVDGVTDTPKVSFQDLPGLPPEKGRMVMVLISDKSLKDSFCLLEARAIIHVVE